ncbi:MAG: CPBP family intramembrane metalloprotease [Pseudomonas sp.]|nr:MAG: CPBP family intramembrane metalloprotease [Pseudomonas sp.]
MTSFISSPIRNEERFARLEDPGTDFPFYNGVPVSISGKQWLFVVAMVVVGFLVLALPIPWPKGTFWQFIPAILMPGIPLVALAYVAPGHWKAIFGKVGGREVKLMFGFALLNIVVSMIVGAIVMALFGATPNRTAAELGGLDTAGQIAFFAKTIPQLLGEEVITLLPFLALLQWFSNGFGMGRKGAIICAWVITSVVFGLIHLPTYDWNWIQCIVVIGSARMMLTLPWILTKNIWVSTGAHIINDWLLFLMGIFGAGLVGKV